MQLPKVLITGASSGIGATYADRLAARGHDLVLVARNRERLQALAERLHARDGVAIEVLPADLGEAADVERVAARLGGDAAIGWLLNNAGIAGSGGFASADPAKVDALLRLNVLASTRLAAAAAAAFAARGGGTIVNMASVTALMPERFETVYLASKAYLLALSQSMASELDGTGIRVQAVLPGVTRTEIWERSGHDLDALPPEMVMSVEDLVDAALRGLELGEVVTIPSLPDVADWDAFTRARLKLAPVLSRSAPAARYTAAA